MLCNKLRCERYKMFCDISSLFAYIDKINFIFLNKFGKSRIIEETKSNYYLLSNLMAENMIVYLLQRKRKQQQPQQQPNVGIDHLFSSWCVV